MICMEQLVTQADRCLQLPGGRCCLSPNLAKKLAACRCGASNGEKSHLFHRSCLKTWFYSVKNQTSLGCPLCRKTLFQGYWMAHKLRIDRLDKSMVDGDESSAYSSDEEYDSDVGVYESGEELEVDGEGGSCHHCQGTLLEHDAAVEDHTGRHYHTRCWADANPEVLETDLEVGVTLDDAISEMLLEHAVTTYLAGGEVTESYQVLLDVHLRDPCSGEDEALQEDDQEKKEKEGDDEPDLEDIWRQAYGETDMEGEEWSEEGIVGWLVLDTSRRYPNWLEFPTDYHLPWHRPDRMLKHLSCVA